MIPLKTLVLNKDSLAEGLQHNAVLHISYKCYTSMDIALCFLLDGFLLLTDGKGWNDRPDGNQMRGKKSFGKSFSFSTRENVAMWMLYGANRGKNGVAINFTRSHIQDVLKSDSVDVVHVIPGEEIRVLKTLKKGVDYNIYCTDVLYAEQVRFKGTEEVGFRITYREEHETVGKDLIEDDRIITKSYEWKYENECRLIVNLTDSGDRIFEGERKRLEEEKNQRDEKQDRSSEKKDFLAIRLFVPGYRKLNADSIIRSPVYNGKAIFGKKSALFGTVNWDL